MNSQREHILVLPMRFIWTLALCAAVYFPPVSALGFNVSAPLPTVISSLMEPPQANGAKHPNGMKLAHINFAMYGLQIAAPLLGILVTEVLAVVSTRLRSQG